MADKNFDEMDLTEEELEALSGGYVTCNDEGGWDVIDNQGDVVYKCATRKEASAKAKELGLSRNTLSYIELEDMRDSIKNHHEWWNEG